jgi:hypothetical protein
LPGSNVPSAEQRLTPPAIVAQPTFQPERALRRRLPKIPRNQIAPSPFAVGLPQFAELVGQLDGERVCLHANSQHGPITITTAGDDHILTLLMPMRWNFQKAAAA